MARRWVLFAVICGLAVAGATAGAARWARDDVLHRLSTVTMAATTLHAAVLRTELEKYRSLPFVIALDADVTRTITSGDPAQRVDLSRKLARLRDEASGNLLYVQDASGVIISSSQWLMPNGFVNCTCTSGYYFKEALEGPALEFFAKGRDGRPGFYITQSVPGPSGPIGLVAVKVDFSWLEAQWRASGVMAFVTDRQGVVLISSVPGWRFRTAAPLSAADRAAIVASGLFRGEALSPIPADAFPAATPTSRMSLELPGRRGPQDVVVSRTPVGASGWTLHLITPSAEAVEAAEIGGGVIALLAGVLLAGILALLLWRRERRRAETLRGVAAREELEARVRARTSELTDANLQLVEQMEARRRMQASVHRLQDELVQANKLATLGQIAAGVAHEINQPVAAIKAYAESAKLLLSRGQQAVADHNMDLIGQLTGRIQVITDELRAFSRRATGRTTALNIGEAIDGALLLVSYRMSQSAVTLTQAGRQQGAMVQGERVKIEQVLVNLLQNALDALAGQEGGRIDITVDDRPESVQVTVADNGPGVAPEIAASLFMPFATTKATGLGLGLVISRDIAAELGGDLTSLEVETGAAFMITLRRAA